MTGVALAKLRRDGRVAHRVGGGAAGVGDVSFVAFACSLDGCEGFVGTQGLVGDGPGFAAQRGHRRVGRLGVGILGNAGGAVHKRDGCGMDRRKFRLQPRRRLDHIGDGKHERMNPQADFTHRGRIDALSIADRDDGIDQRVQHDAARIGLMTVGLDQPAFAQAGGQAFGRCGVAVHTAESLAALDDLLGAVEAAFRQQRREHAVLRRFPGVERLAHGAAVLLHAGGLSGSNAHRVGELLRIEPDQLAARHGCRNGAERTGET